jgi:hypothetical protein
MWVGVGGTGVPGMGWCGRAGGCGWSSVQCVGMVCGMPGWCCVAWLLNERQWWMVPFGGAVVSGGDR